MTWGFPDSSEFKESACNAGDPSSIPGSGKICWRRERLRTPVFWLRESYGLDSPQGRKESDTTECLSHHDLTSTRWNLLIQKCQNHVSPSEFVLSCLVMSNSLGPHGLQPTRLLCPWDSLARVLEWVTIILLQGIFPTQGLNPGLPHCRWILYYLSHQRNPRILERSLSPLQGIFPSQKTNQGFLHYRQILYQLSYQGSPLQNFLRIK